MTHVLVVADTWQFIDGAATLMQGLKAADSNGLSDPYVTVYLSEGSVSDQGTHTTPHAWWVLHVPPPLPSPPLDRLPNRPQQ